MSMLKKTWKFLASCGAGFLATTESPGTPEGKKLFTAEEDLEAAKFALFRIVHLTKNNPAIDQDYCKAIYKIAKNWQK